MADSQGAAHQSANATWEYMRYSSNHSPEAARTRGGLRPRPEPTNSSSTRKSLSYSPSIKRSSIGSTIVVSAGSVSDSAENTISQTAQPSWSILSDGLPALPNCQERGIITTSQSTSTLVFPQTSSSEFLRSSEPQVGEAEHDLLGSKGDFVGLRLPERRAGACTRSSVLVRQHRAGPQDTLHSSTSLFNEQSTTSKRSDGSPINDWIEHSTLFTDFIESGKIMGSSDDMVMDQDQNHQSEATAPIVLDRSGISSHASMQRSMSRDTNGNGNVRSSESSKALDLPLAGDEIGHSNATDDAFGVHILPLINVDNIVARSLDGGVVSDHANQACPTSLINGAVPDSEAASNDPQPNVDTERLSSTSPPVPTATLSNSRETPLANSTLNTSSENARPRKMFIELNTTEANKKQYVAIGFDTSIEELFSMVQNRMTRRLANKEILAFELRLPSQSEGEIDFLVEKNDLDTWEVFLDMVREVTGDKVTVKATVGV